MIPNDGISIYLFSGVVTILFGMAVGILIPVFGTTVGIVIETWRAYRDISVVADVAAGLPSVGAYRTGGEVHKEPDVDFIKPTNHLRRASDAAEIEKLSVQAGLQVVKDLVEKEKKEEEEGAAWAEWAYKKALTEIRVDQRIQASRRIQYTISYGDKRQRESAYYSSEPGTSDSSKPASYIDKLKTLFVKNGFRVTLMGKSYGHQYIHVAWGGN